MNVGIWLMSEGTHVTHIVEKEKPRLRFVKVNQKKKRVV
jgi:hypothetical protein